MEKYCKNSLGAVGNADFAPQMNKYIKKKQGCNVNLRDSSPAFNIL